MPRVSNAFLLRFFLRFRYFAAQVWAGMDILYTYADLRRLQGRIHDQQEDTRDAIEALKDQAGAIRVGVAANRVGIQGNAKLIAGNAKAIAATLVRIDDNLNRNSDSLNQILQILLMQQQPQGAQGA